MTQQEMTKEQILCNKKWVNPSGREMIIYMEAMEEYANQELAKERERAAKLVEAAEAVMKSWSERMNNEIEEEKESKIEGIKYWSPSASMVSSSEINKLRQSLTEYKK